jgi:hypothetical protein
MERDWQSMIRITHDFFHAWRKSVADSHGEPAAKDMEMRFWENIGLGTGRMYLARGGTPDDPGQIAFTMKRASDIMGETAHIAQDGDATLLVHTACPWIDSYRAAGLPNQCGAGCDHWFQTTVKTISPNLKVITESQLPRGDASCTRRFSVTKG